MSIPLYAGKKSSSVDLVGRFETKSGLDAAISVYKKSGFAVGVFRDSVKRELKESEKRADK